MRDIKFRGQLLDDAVWVYGYFWDKPLIYGHNPMIYVEYAEEDSGIADTGWLGVSRKTIGQYTGLKDKNGVEIYEGDICAFTNPYINRSFIREVKFCPMFACFGLYKKDGSVYDYESDWLKITNIEVIGNIYENPELLK